MTLAAELASHPFVKGLKPEQVQALLEMASPVEFERDSFMFEEGAVADRVFLILEGTVVLEAETEHGPVQIQTVADGDVLGWSWLIPPYAWRFSGRVTETTRAIALDAVPLRVKVKIDHELGYKLLTRLMRVMAARLESTRAHLLHLYEMWP